MKILKYGEINESNRKIQRVECIKDFEDYLPEWVKEQEGWDEDQNTIFFKGKVYKCGKEYETLSGSIIRDVYSDIFNDYYEREYPGTFPKYMQRITDKFYIKQPDSFYEQIEKRKKLTQEMRDKGYSDMADDFEKSPPTPKNVFEEYFKLI